MVKVKLFTNNMDMGSGAQEAQHQCKISMLWNWTTIDACFLARSWHVRTPGMFAGSCIGVFLLVFVSQWLSRISKEFDMAVDSGNTVNYSEIRNPTGFVLSHKWLSNPARTSVLNHIIKCLLFTTQWGVSYIIMLLFMYYNGYIIISCILGAFFGRMVFYYNDPITSEEQVSCCKT